MEKTNIYKNVAGFRCLDRIDRQTEDLCLTRCGIQQCPPNHSWGPKARPQYHMHIILDGCGYFEIENQKFHLSRGQIFLIPPNITSHYYADPTNPWHYAWVSFVGTHAERYVKQAGFSDGIYVRDSYFPPEKYSALIFEMLEAHKMTITNELKRIGTLFLFFSLLTESNQALNSSGKKSYEYSSSTYLEHALQFIQFNYNRNIQISDIAEYIGITRSYLFNIFKTNLNISPKDYLLRYRMNKAKKFLETTTDSIQQISENVGYTDPLSFSKMFRHCTGISPSQYRKNIKKNKDITKNPPN